jgi:peptidoglycan/xylan/chitin deacetylase (PgdA/CDA1 family)
MKFKPNKQQLLSLLPDAVVLTRGPRDGDALYLSFDDGPHPEHTPRLLDLLSENDAKASFFLIGKQVEKHPALAARIVAEGHALGNHSYTHPPAFGKTTLRSSVPISCWRRSTANASIDSGRRAAVFRCRC